MCTVRSASRNCCSGASDEQLRIAEIFRLEPRDIHRGHPAAARTPDCRCARAGRGGDLRAGEEALEAAVEQRRVAEAHRVLPQIVPAAGRRTRQPIDESGRRAQRADQRPPALHQLRGALPLVAGEELVAAFAAEDHLHVLRGKPRQVPDRHRRGGRARLVEGASARRERCPRPPSAASAGRRARSRGARRFVAPRPFRRSLDCGKPMVNALIRWLGRSRHRRRDRARVDSAREKRADRHVRQHVAIDRAQHALARLLDPVVLRHAFPDRKRGRQNAWPVAAPVGPR